MNHCSSVFTNSCLNVPVDPISKMPKTEYERTKPRSSAHSSIDSCSSYSVLVADLNLDSKKLKDFYCSIPDYNDINHLPSEEFYSTLKKLRETRKIMLGLPAEEIDGFCDGLLDSFKSDDITMSKLSNNNHFISKTKKSVGNKNNLIKKTNSNFFKESTQTCTPKTKNSKICSKEFLPINNIEYDNKKACGEFKIKSTHTSQCKLNKINSDCTKRNNSACSISWNDTKIESKDEVDKKFTKFFEGIRYVGKLRPHVDEFKTQSMPSSPMRTIRHASPLKRRKSITITKPFKMTERDEEIKALNELKSLRKSYSEDVLNKSFEQKKFRAKPVPVESRIPLYDKILEDQAMRRAITKINSEAELRAQMKPFSFTKREEKGLGGLCDRAVLIIPKSKKKKKFKARPVPRNLFSNYFYDRVKEAEFFRSMNKRIRAEEMLRSAHYPSNMAARNPSRLSTPGAHSDLPIDPSPALRSVTSSHKQRCVSPTKERKNKDKFSKDYLITTSPQPFRLNTADRAAKKMEDVAKKLYQESKSSESVRESGRELEQRNYSVLELPSNSTTGRSNLAALLRAESVRRRFEIDAAKRSEEHRRKVEMKQRDRLLRTKPAWHLVKNNHEEDIAMRLQTRRDEERMRREEFLHEMELMYGRVQQQPMMFERYYAPRSDSAPIDTIQLSPRKVKKRSKSKGFQCNTSNRSRKVSINDSAEVHNDDVADYLNRIEIDDKYSDSEILESLDKN